jgi:hypothetical protein
VPEDRARACASVYSTGLGPVLATSNTRLAVSLADSKVTGGTVGLSLVHIFVRGPAGASVVPQVHGPTCMALRALASVLVVATAFVGCSADHANVGTTGAAAAAAGGSCTWSADLGTLTDASPGQCTAAFAYLSCTNGGVTEGCLSNDVTQCPGTIMVSGGGGNADGASTVSSGPLVCHDECASDEYGVECGGIGPTASAGQPPASCRGMGITPGGTEFFCCLCGP